VVFPLLQELKPTNFFVLAGARIEATPNNPCGFDLTLSNGEKRSMQVGGLSFSRKVNLGQKT